MSQEDAERAKRALTAFNRRDIDGMLEYFDPEVEWHTATDLPDSRVYRGHDGVAALIQEWDNLFEGLHGDAGEYIARGEYVVAPILFRGRIPGSPESDPEVTLLRIHVGRWREGRCVELHEYLTLEAALEAAGVSE